MAEGGLEAMHVADVAARASVAHGTFYVHFPSKQALLDALLERLEARLARDVAAAFARGASLDEAIHGAARAFLGACVEEAPLVRALAERAAAGVAPGSLVDGINPPALALMRALLASRVTPEALELTAHALLAAWLRVALRVVLADADLELAARTLTTLTRGAVAALDPGESR